MFIDNESVDGADQNQGDVVEPTITKADFDALKSQNDALLNEFKALQAAQTKPQEVKPLTKEEFAKLLQDDPQSAIEYAVSNKITDAVGKVDKNLTAKQQAAYFDQKASVDFPLIEKDKKFQDLVKNETKTLIEAGMHKDSPMLVYKAAEIAALKYTGAQTTIKANENKSAGGSEAPTTIRTQNKDAGKYLPKNFDKLSAAFNLSDKAKEKAAENFKFRAEQEAARKNRG